MKKKKVCTLCNKKLSLNNFYEDKRYKDKLRACCKKCKNKRVKSYRKKNPEQWRKYQKTYYEKNKNKPEFKMKRREYSLIRRYGLTIKDYDKLFKLQNRKCAICGKHQKEMRKRLSIDHNHKTGFVRGLLCYYCNSKLLRYLRDNKNCAVGLVNYLQAALKKDKNW